MRPIFLFFALVYSYSFLYSESNGRSLQILKDPSGELSKIRDKNIHFSGKVVDQFGSQINNVLVKVTCSKYVKGKTSAKNIQKVEKINHMFSFDYDDFHRVTFTFFKKGHKKKIIKISITDDKQEFYNQEIILQSFPDDLPKLVSGKIKTKIKKESNLWVAHVKRFSSSDKSKVKDLNIFEYKVSDDKNYIEILSLPGVEIHTSEEHFHKMDYYHYSRYMSSIKLQKNKEAYFYIKNENKYVGKVRAYNVFISKHKEYGEVSFEFYLNVDSKDDLRTIN